MRADNAWTAFAQTRARELPVRLGFGVFLGLAAWTLADGRQALLWFSAMTAAQGLEVLAFSPLRRAPEREPGIACKAAFVAAIVANALLYTGVAVVAWFEGGLAGKLFAMLTPAGALLNVALSLDRAPRSMMAAWAPHVGYLTGLPIVHGLVTPQEDLIACLFVSSGGLMFVLHVGMAVTRIRRSSASMADAVRLAECERTRAEEANAAKSDFLASMSHEIRTPMNAVVASAQLLRRSRLSRAQSEQVDMLANASELLMGVLNDVLDLSKIESGKLAIHCEPAALVQKLDSTVRLWRPPADDKGLRLRFDPGDLPAHACIDSLRLQQILFNLLSNAVKFTDHGEVALRGGRIAREDGEVLWIEVCDTGCGMAPDVAERVFAPFEQGSSGVTRKHGGTGLGLSISRRLAELMGGSLTVRSLEGVGSTFRLETPMIPVERQPRAPEAPSAEAETADEAMEVLLAEDHEVNQQIVRLILEPLGMRVTVAHNGLEAVALAGSRPFDVILMDMQMPLMGGVEAAGEIRRSGGPNAVTPILALTANVMDEHRAQWAAAGVEVLLPKPIDMQALVAAVCAAPKTAEAAAA